MVRDEGFDFDFGIFSAQLAVCMYFASKYIILAYYIMPASSRMGENSAHPLIKMLHYMDSLLLLSIKIAQKSGR